MRDSRDLVDLLALAHAEECRFSRSLSADERSHTGTPDAPAPKDVLAHVAHAKGHLSRALEHRRRRSAPNPPYHRRQLPVTGPRTFADVDADLERQTEALIAEVARLGARDLASRPPWIEAPTLADEIARRAVTHGLGLLYRSLAARGAMAECVRIQEDLVVALPDSTSEHLRGDALYHLACLYGRDGRLDDARETLHEALRVQPALAALAASDADLEPLRR